MATLTASPAGTVLNPQLPGHTLNEWAVDVLKGLNVPVNATNVDTLMKWASAESGSGNPNVCAGRFNPLNTTETHYGTACQGGSQGNIAGYSTYTQGVDSIVWNLTHGTQFGYDEILAGFRNSDQAATFAAIDASKFGTHGLGAGSGITSNAAGSSSAASTTATTTAAKSCAGCPEGCILHIPMPSVIPNIDFTRCQGRALLGAFTLVAGVGIMFIGLALVGASKFGAKILAAAPLVK